MYKRESTCNPDHCSSRRSQKFKPFKMNKSILLVILPCVIAAILVSADNKVSYASYSSGYSGYPAYYGGQLNAYGQQNAFYNAGNIAAQQLQSARLLNYLFGFLLLLDLTNATGNSITRLG